MINGCNLQKFNDKRFQRSKKNVTDLTITIPTPHTRHHTIEITHWISHTGYHTLDITHLTSDTRHQTLDIKHLTSHTQHHTLFTTG